MLKAAPGRLPLHRTASHENFRDYFKEAQRAAETKAFLHHSPSLSLSSLEKVAKTNKSRRWTGIFAPVVVFLFLCSLLFSSLRSDQTRSIVAYAHGEASSLSTSASPSAFSGAFSRFPSVSQLLPRHQRITLVVHWTHDVVPDYFASFFNSAQHNADVVDVLFVNRIVDPKKKCIDFNKTDFDVTWGGNIKHVCLSQDDWAERLVNVLCDAETGWKCDAAQRQKVKRQALLHPDANGWHWKPFRGMMYEDLFLHADQPLWAWIDLDTFVGDFRHFPFTLLSNSSFITFSPGSAQEGRMFGQMTAWNMDDHRLRSVWQQFPSLQSPEHFVGEVDGIVYEPSNEECEWSYRYMNVDEGFPGRDLTFIQLADAQADDFFDLSLETDVGDSQTRQSMQVIVSGRDILVANGHLSRPSTEQLVEAERDAFVDQRGWAGWSAGYDASEEMLRDPHLTMEQATDAHASAGQTTGTFHGVLESVRWSTGNEGCPSAWWIPAQWRLCLPNSESVPTLRTSFVHFSDHEPGFLFARKETDHRPRGHARYLIKHTLRSKQYEWLQMPRHQNISTSHVFTLQNDRLQVWQMGQEAETVFNRQSDGQNRIGE